MEFTTQQLAKFLVVAYKVSGWTPPPYAVAAVRARNPDGRTRTRVEETLKRVAVGLTEAQTRRAVNEEEGGKEFAEWLKAAIVKDSPTPVKKRSK